MNHTFEIPNPFLTMPAYKKAEVKYILYVHELALHESPYTLRDEASNKEWDIFKEKTFAEIRSLMEEMSKEDKTKFLKLVLTLER